MLTTAAEVLGCIMPTLSDAVGAGLLSVVISLWQLNLFKVLKNSIKITWLFLLSKGLLVAMVYSTGIADNIHKCYIGIFAVDFGPGKGNRKS